MMPFFFLPLKLDDHVPNLLRDTAAIQINSSDVYSG